MKLKIYADRTFILNEIKQITSEIEEEHKTTDYNSVIENAISELIKIDMRELAHRDQSEQWYSGERILSQALDVVRDNLVSIKPTFDFSDYFKAAEETLRIPARELSDLRTKLRVSKEKDLTGDQTSAGGVQPYQVKELGLKGAIERGRKGTFYISISFLGLVETPKANLSIAMRQLNGMYTQSFNRAHKRVGHLFQGRLKRSVVEI